MSNARARSVPSAAPGPPPTARPSPWAGWIVFGAMVMILLGAFQAITGVVALVDDEYYAVSPSGLVVNVSYTSWGWVHLVLGLVAVVTGYGLLSGARWARILGICVAFVSALVNFAFIAAYPLWCVAMIALDVLVIYAIAAHGREVWDGE